MCLRVIQDAGGVTWNSFLRKGVGGDLGKSNNWELDVDSAIPVMTTALPFAAVRAIEVRLSGHICACALNIASMQSFGKHHALFLIASGLGTNL